MELKQRDYMVWYSTRNACDTCRDVIYNIMVEIFCLWWRLKRSVRTYACTHNINKQTKIYNECAPECSVQGESCDIDPDCENHEDYLSEFKSILISKLRDAIDADLKNDPDCIKGRKKTVQVSELKDEYLFCIQTEKKNWNFILITNPKQLFVFCSYAFWFDLLSAKHKILNNFFSLCTCTASYTVELQSSGCIQIFHLTFFLSVFIFFAWKNRPFNNTTGDIPELRQPLSQLNGCHNSTYFLINFSQFLMFTVKFDLFEKIQKKLRKELQVS